MSDLKDIQQPLARLTGDDLHDELVGFMGDMRMRWLEHGLQKGGRYRYGSGCGLPISLFPCYADSVCAQIPSIVDLQERATAGHFGKMAGQNLHYLKAGEVRTELVKPGVRRVHAVDRTDQLQTLKDLLKGVQHLPALLAKTPRVSPDTHGLAH